MKAPIEQDRHEKGPQAPLLVVIAGRRPDRYLAGFEGVHVAVDPGQGIQVGATDGQRAAVLAGIGLTVASGFAFGPELKSGEVVSVLDDWVLSPIDLFAVYPTGRMASTKARAFVSFVEECLRE